MPKHHHRTRTIGTPKKLDATPRWLRPKLNSQSKIDLGLAHHQNVDAVAKGEGNEEILWQMYGGVLTWDYVAKSLGLGIPEMDAQAMLLAEVVLRFGRTGKVVFTGHEYQLAKEGAFVMDELASQVDAYTAMQAAVWSEDKIKEMAAKHANAQRTEDARA